MYLIGLLALIGALEIVVDPCHKEIFAYLMIRKCIKSRRIYETRKKRKKSKLIKTAESLEKVYLFLSSACNSKLAKASNVEKRANQSDR